MKRRDVLYFMGLSVTGLLTLRGFAQEESGKEKKEEVVTLAITGMT